MMAVPFIMGAISLYVAVVMISILLEIQPNSEQLSLALSNKMSTEKG